MNPNIGLDFETYGGVDLPKHGLDRYVSDSTFVPLMARTYMHDDNGTIREGKFDFVEDYYESARKGLDDTLGEATIVAHNAPFEERVMRWMKLEVGHRDFIDSAVVARAAGAAGSLEAAAPQLLGSDKYEPGKALMRLFSIPGKYQEANGSLEFDPLVVKHNPGDWAEYGKYCGIDAMLGWHIVDQWGFIVNDIDDIERENTVITHEMNDVGWPVDRALVEEMQRRYLDNMDRALVDFRTRFEAGIDEKDWLNFNSFPQLKKWCEARGVKAKSFDEEHVTMYLAKIRKRIDDHAHTMKPDQLKNLLEVQELLRTKQILGGSSLKKLQTILDQVGPDNRLRGQYLHIGAGQTWRTSGRGVQMQNLKQLREVKDMDELEDEDIEWDNDELARNLRQVFTASDEEGRLIVGDFGSVESRGLAYLAGAEWKLKAFRLGLDMYKVLAAKIDGTLYEDVTKPRRQFGKVGELSCGYQASGSAVQRFAKKMGTVLTEGEANQLVFDWRGTNPEVVDLWELLNDLLLRVVVGKASIASKVLASGCTVEVFPVTTPDSLLDLHATAQSICVRLCDPRGKTFVRRYFHGCYERGRNICHYKPTKKKTGDVWVSHYRDPQTDEIRFYSIYGGKLAGILTQSMCREMFFASLRKLDRSLQGVVNVQIVGQFHDEIVLDWQPTGRFLLGNTWTLEGTEAELESCMSDPGPLVGFPLVAEIKHDYRYTK